MRPLTVIALVFSFAFVSAPTLSAACMNKFTVRTDGALQTVTLLTGKLTFQDAQALALGIRDGHAPSLEWVDDNGKTIAKEYGNLRVVRPMPVNCDATPSGVVMIATFATVHAPSKKISLKLDANTTVVFDEQAK